MDQSSLMTFDPNNQSMGQYVQAQSALQNLGIPLQQLQGQGQLQLQGQHLPMLQLGQGGQFMLNHQQLLQQLGQSQGLQLPGQGGGTSAASTQHQQQQQQSQQLQGQAIQLPQQLQQQLQHLQQVAAQQGQPLQFQGPNGQMIQLPSSNGQTIQLPVSNGQTIQLQGAGGQTLQLQAQGGQHIQVQSSQQGAAQALQQQHLQQLASAHNGLVAQQQQQQQQAQQQTQTIQLQGPNGQVIQVQVPSNQALHSGGGGIQVLQLPNGQQIQIGAGTLGCINPQQQQQVAALQQLQNSQQQALQQQLQSYQLQNQLGQVCFQLQNNGQLQAVHMPTQQQQQQLQMMSLQAGGQPCQLVHVQGPNGQIMQQLVPLMFGADQLANHVNPLQQQLLAQAQQQQQVQHSPMVGQFVQTEGGLVWQPAGMFPGSALDSNVPTSAVLAAHHQQQLQLSHAGGINQNQAIDSTANHHDLNLSASAENHGDQETSDSQHQTLINGETMSSIPGSTATSTIITSNSGNNSLQLAATNAATLSQVPAGRVQIAAEDPEDETSQPMYVNAKQYHRILKRRAARAKLESTGKVIRKRKVSDVSHCSKPLRGLYNCCAPFSF
ncbi:hypothetical protein EGW08_015637 [Elysia chlorotica]|uniref:Nuclear transcription factor Y subunit n=1 Tax=Elysia chlorotica TaxID=188477 RepID=A0A3S1BBB3_ELYCH|nr:hypothetical protein EGW08_015637 [Elysia chlorotica]